MTPTTQVMSQAMPQVTLQVPEAGSAVAKPGGKRFYQPELDGLRFYAFLGVFAYHTLPSAPGFYRSLHLPLPTLWAAVVKGGSAGVDLFFALSAYLITSLLVREIDQTGDISLRLFYMRRILRIWPLYFAVLGVGVLLAHTVAGQSLAWYYIAGFLMFIGNWVTAAVGHPESVAAPLWTVSIEEQFYLLWPLLMRALSRRGMIVASSVTLLGSTLSQVAIVKTGLSGGYIYYGSLSRCAALALGVLLALFPGRLSRLTSATRGLLLGGGLVSWTVASAWLLDQPGLLDERMVLGRLMVSLGAGAILLSALNCRSLVVRARPIVSLGKISYGLYMLHPIGILLSLRLLHASWGFQLLAAKGVGLVVTILLAMASYRWLETPFLKLKDRYAVVLSRSV